MNFFDEQIYRSQWPGMFLFFVHPKKWFRKIVFLLELPTWSGFCRIDFWNMNSIYTPQKLRWISPQKINGTLENGDVTPFEYDHF